MHPKHRDTRRRAAHLRDRAHSLANAAQREPFPDRRRHLLDLAASYLRAAQDMAPAPTGQPIVG
jgi:hypothetical protein